jgi:phosphoribosylanthranilate isomerase
MNVKVCGITSVEQLQNLQQLGVDYAGMIFYEGSARYAGEKLTANKGKIKSCPIQKVGVFVNATMEKIQREMEAYGLTAVQLHGDESPEMCKALMDKVKVIKVFRVTGDENIDDLIAPCQDACHYFLFDTDTKGYGGSGKQFNWEMLTKANINKPFFLSGGIGMEDVARLKTFYHPHLFAVDVNSRFETAPGIKDMERVKKFLKSL